MNTQFVEILHRQNQLHAHKTQNSDSIKRGIDRELIRDYLDSFHRA